MSKIFSKNTVTLVIGVAAAYAAGALIDGMLRGSSK
jgi:hypothetical protein